MPRQGADDSSRRTKPTILKRWRLEANVLEQLLQSRSIKVARSDVRTASIRNQAFATISSATVENTAAFASATRSQGWAAQPMPPHFVLPTVAALSTRTFAADAEAMRGLADQINIGYPGPAASVQAAVHGGFAEVSQYINLATDGVVGLNDVDALLHRLTTNAAPLERGVVGPTGASATISMSVLGPIFGLYGFYAGCQIVSRSGDAKLYLQKVNEEIDKRRASLLTLQRGVDDPAGLKENLIELQRRIDAMEAFRAGIRNSLLEQTFNQTFPGLVQLTASALILTLAVELAPTIGGGTALVPHAASAALSITAAGVLGVYAAGSLAKNLTGFAQACRTRKLPLQADDSDLARDYITNYNRGIGVERLFYGLNSVSWGVYVAGCVTLMLIASGAALSHGAAVGAVVGGALAAVIWDQCWGERVGPHNALTPHVDRNYINSWDRRVSVWALLHEERKHLQSLVDDVLAKLPPGAKRGKFGPLKVWQNVSKEARYAYVWKHVPKFGGVRRLAKWSSHETSLVDGKLHDYMCKYVHLEINYLQEKLQNTYKALVRRQSELANMNEVPGAPVDKLLELWHSDLTIVCEEHTRLAALQGLHRELYHLDLKAINTEPTASASWTRARLAFMSINGYLGFFITRKMVLEHPEWFRFIGRKTRILRRTLVHNVRMSPTGYDAMVQAGFSQSDARRFIMAIVNPSNNAYELEAVHQIEKAERRSADKRAKENAERLLSVQRTV